MADHCSDAAVDLIVIEEDSGPGYYARHYTHFEWPLGSSGPTIGIGYDCGYVTAEEARKDWDGVVPVAMIDAICAACGLKGESAHGFVRAHGGTVTITWDQALKQFRERELPKWEAIVKNRLQNTGALSGDSFGALVSLTYNRGPSFDAPGSRFAEMRAIRQHMALKEFARIPDDILAMRRLWPRGGDLWRRRTHEASLFSRGLVAQ